MKNYRAVFLDRDGTVIEHVHYINDPDKVVLIPGVAEALRKIRDKGYLVYIISNQSGLARGYISQAQFEAVHERVCEELKKFGAEITGFGYCFHHPEELCECRKPKTGLVARSYEGAPILLEESYMVGDNPCDLELAAGFGGEACLVLTGDGQKTKAKLSTAPLPFSYLVCKDLLEFAENLPNLSLKD